MKKTFIVFLAFIACYQVHANAKKLKANLNYATFYAAESGSFIETYLSVAGESVVFAKNQNGKYQATIQISMIFTEDNLVKNFKKYELLSPEVADSTQANFNFIDLQRILLPIGKFNFELTISDKNNPNQKFKNDIPIEINYDDQSVIVSGIQLVESYTKTVQTGVLSKSGYDLVPKVSNYYPASSSKLTIYAEIYNTAKILGDSAKYLISTYIQNAESSKKMQSFTKHKKEKAAQVNTIFNDFDISTLPSGNYNIVIEVKDRENKLVGLNTTFFQRNNPDYMPTLATHDSTMLLKSFVSAYPDDSIKQFIKYLRPIAAGYEKEFIDRGSKSASIRTMKAFMYDFWVDRNEANPEGAWLNYLSQVQIVNKIFTHGNGKVKGYDTDRGRVYLQYGPPNTVNENPFDSGHSSTLSDNELNKGITGAVPYEIWHYYRIKNQSNKVFVFYNPHLIPKGYELLHSDVQGELYNPQWKSHLSRIQFENIDGVSN
jgi:GWxTD domain-containing protein